MAGSSGADPIDHPTAAADDAQNLNGNDSIHYGRGGNDNAEVDLMSEHGSNDGKVEAGSNDVEDEDGSDDEVEDDEEDGSDYMDDEYEAINAILMQRHIANIFNPKAIEKECLKLFEEQKADVKHTLNNMGRLIPLSVDILSDYKPSGEIIDYVRLAANFVDDEWKLKNWVLHFRLYDIWKSDFVDAVIVKTLDDYSLTGKVHTLTSRDADTIDEVIESIESQIKERNMLPSETHLFHVSCCAEMFGLMAEDAFEEISDIISMLKELSWSKSECMWHLTNTKIKNVLDLDALGEFSSASVTDHYSVPSAEEWEKVRVVHRLVEHANDAAKKVFLVKSSTANLFLYHLQELRASLLAEAAKPDAFTLKIAKKMLRRLDKYIRQNYLALAITSVMDPRCKMQYVDEVSTNFETTDGILQHTALLEVVRRVYSDYSSAGITSNDLDVYLEEPVLPWDESFDVLKWWKSIGGPKYPHLSKMACEILAIPMSVATSYDAYYYIENRPADRRVITSGPEAMNAMMCSWSWKLGKSGQNAY